MVQTTPTMTAEVTVVHTLLNALDMWPPEHRPQILLLQGIDGKHPDGRQAAETFRRLSWLTVRSFEIGGLGRASGSKTEQAMKVMDLTRLRVARRRLQRLLQEFQPDVIYSAQQRWDQRLAVPLARLSGRPRVVHLHYTVGPWLGSQSVRALRAADTVLAISDFIHQDAIAAGVPGDRIHTTHNPAPYPSVRANATPNVLRRELGISDDAAVVGMVGRLCETKCQLELLDAMLPLLRVERSVHLVFAGAEDPVGNGVREQLQQRAADAGVFSQVRLLGYRSDIPTVLDSLDVFAHPSRDEPFGLAILEAMAHGLPVVAWRQGGPAEVVSDPDTGILVAPMDITGLTEAIASLLANRDRRKAMGAAGRARVDRAFRADDAAGRFVELLGAATWARPRVRPAVKA
jgi:glycosyltransferase involved in cell wall biosynthesis